MAQTSPFIGALTLPPSNMRKPLKESTAIDLAAARLSAEAVSQKWQKRNQRFSTTMGSAARKVDAGYHSLTMASAHTERTATDFAAARLSAETAARRWQERNPRSCSSYRKTIGSSADKVTAGYRSLARASLHPERTDIDMAAARLLAEAAAQRWQKQTQNCRHPSRRGSVR